MLSTATPTILASLGGMEFYSLTFTAKTLTAAVGYLIVGKMADKFGRRNVMCVGTFLVFLGYVLSALSTSITMLIASRAVSGFGAGLTLSLGYIILGDFFKGKIYGNAYVIMTLACGIACVIGGPLGGVFCSGGNWTMVFWVLAPLPIVTMLITYFCCPNYVVDSSDVKFDALGCVLFTIATILLVLVLSISGTFTKFTSPAMLISLVCSIAIYVWFFVHENRIDEQSCIFPVKLIKQDSHE